MPVSGASAGSRAPPRYNVCCLCRAYRAACLCLLHDPKAFFAFCFPIDATA